MNIFEYTNYREVMTKYLDEQVGSRGYKASLARAIGCQGSYVSQVLVGKVHLTPDQAVALSDFWELGEQETDYFLALVNFERAGTDRLRKRISAELSHLKSLKIKPATQAKAEIVDPVELSAEQLNFYWSRWECSAIHEILRLEDHRNINAIASRLNLAVPLVKKILERLAEMDLVRLKGGEWHRLRAVEQLSQDETHAQNFHRSLRTRSNERLMYPDKVQMTVSTVDTIARSELPQLVKALQDAAKKQMDLSSHRNPDELMSLCIDVFIL